MQPSSVSQTCSNCGAELAAPQLPCPYCGQLSATAPAAPGPAWPPGGSSGQYVPAGAPPTWPAAGQYVPPSAPPVWPAAAAPAQVWAMPQATIVVPRRSRLGCLIIGAIVLVSVVVPLAIAAVALQAANRAISNIPNLVPPIAAFTPADPVAEAALHLDQLKAYMKAGMVKDADSAYALYIHDASWEPSSRDDIAKEFSTHPEHYQGFVALIPVDFVRVHVTGGPSYWEVRATAMYMDGKSRPVQADLSQQGDGWQLIEVKFTDEQ